MFRTNQPNQPISKIHLPRYPRYVKRERKKRKIYTNQARKAKDALPYHTLSYVTKIGPIRSRLPQKQGVSVSH